MNAFDPKPDDLLFLDWLNAYHRNGERPVDKADEFVERVIAEGWAATFLREYARDIVKAIWEQATQGTRRSLETGRQRSSRRHNLQLLGDEQSVFDALYNIDGIWVPLGDLTKGGCVELESRHTKWAEGNFRKVLFFKALAKRLSGEDSVRSKFAEEEVLALLKESESWTLPAL